MSGASSSLLVGEIELISSDDGTASTAMDVDATEPVFAGHYPGFPIFPGVCLIEFAHRSAQCTPPHGAGSIKLTMVSSARFLSPVYPGDRLEAELGWTAKDGDWQCSAVLSTKRGGRAAQVRLRYRAGDTG
jgi:3-hydroxyacyl-[acyl-carrier-protein] dehydratase